MQNTKLEVLNLLEKLEQQLLGSEDLPLEKIVQNATWVMSVTNETCQGIIAVARTKGEVRDLGLKGLSKRREMLKELATKDKG